LEKAAQLYKDKKRKELRTSLTTYIEASIRDGMLATAPTQLDLLAKMLGEEREEAARLRKLLGEGELQDRRRPKPTPLINDRKLVKKLGLAKGGVGDAVAHSPRYIGETNMRALAGMPPKQIAGFLAHFSGAADGAARALAAHRKKALPLIKRLLKDKHHGISVPGYSVP
jgi:hypothetical protein